MLRPISGMNTNMYSIINQQSKNRFQGANRGGSGESQSSSGMDQKAIQWSDALKNMNLASQDLYGAAFKLQKLMKQEYKASSTDVNIKAEAMSDAQEGTMTVDVKQTAQKMTVKSGTFADVNAALNLSGSFQINNVTFNVTDVMSATNIKDLINEGNAGVTASVVGNELHITSNTEGAAGAFTMTDLTSDTNTTTSSDQNIANVTSLTSETDWSHDVNVIQLSDTDHSDDFTVQEAFINDAYGFSWDSQNLIKEIGTEEGGLFKETGFDRNTSTTVQFSLSQANDGDVGAELSYVDSNNWVRAVASAANQKLYIQKMVNGVYQRAVVGANIEANTSYELTATDLGGGTFQAVLQDQNGNQIAAVSASGWTDAITSGLQGLYSTSSTAQTTIEGWESEGIYTTTQNTIYEVDGIQYTSNSNTVTIGDGATNQATVSLNNIGSTTISNVRDNNALGDMGFLNADGTFKNMEANAQDAVFSVDGGADITRNTNNVIYNNTEMTFYGTTSSPVTITIENPDGGSGNSKEATKEAIVDFVSEYNTIIGTMQGYNEFLSKEFVKDMQNAFSKNKSVLSSIGITKNKDGTLKVDDKKLDLKLNDGTFDVQKTFLSKNKMGQMAMDYSNEFLKTPEKYMVKLSSQSTGSMLNQYY